MIDFVVAGSTGFIGRHLAAGLAEMGLSAVSDRDFSQSNERAKIFVNCANDKSGPFNSVALLREKFALARDRVSVFVHLQSFSTLQGAERGIDRTRFNLGLVPRLLSPYALGKLLQEEELCRCDRPMDPEIWLIYLPAILGEGGIWSAVTTAAQKNGFKLPHPMSGSARANFIFVDDMAAFFQQKVSGGYGRAGIVSRFVLNRPEAENMSWADFLSTIAGCESGEPVGRNARSPVVEIEPLVALAKRFVIFSILVGLGYFWRCRLASFLAKFAAGNKPSARHKHKEPRAFGDKPVEIGGLSRYLVANQPYIPALN